MRSCLRISTTNGNFEVEHDERFSLSLQKPPGQVNRIIISPSSGHVVIKDNDGEELSHNVYNCDAS